ncbi:MAG: hypothetical protein QG597_3798 [Actinomycetota bacterium]|nr:hypothetical protein [Actinomycetota bacterium]
MTTEERLMPHTGYEPTPGAFDEMFDADGRPRPGLDHLESALQALGSEGLRERGRVRDSHLTAQGITFTLSGRERPLPMDLIPRVIAADEWRMIDQGVGQRIRALEMFLDDVYNLGQILSERIVPRALVTSSAHFHRAVHGFQPPNGVRIHVAGVDLVRDQEGTIRVLEDNLRNPSGVSYVLENRRTLAHVVPEIFPTQRVRAISEYPEKLFASLLASGPRGVPDPTVVVLTPGVHNSAHFEHAFLARRMGTELVEGRDLFCREGSVFMRTTKGPRQVHVIYRRIDDEFLDPVHWRPDSLLGIPGILNAARAGTVSIANAIGNGVADDKALYPYVPKIIEYYLGEKPILPNVPTYDLQDDDVRAYVLERLDTMVLKPVDGSGGYGLVMGHQASDAELDTVAQSILAEPRAWVAQPVLTLSTSPSAVGDGLIEPRHVDLRPFAVNDGENVWVLPGGLTRVALRKGSLVVNSSQGGGSKDTWVLDDGQGGISAEPKTAAVADGTAEGFIGIDRRYRRQPGWRETGPRISEERMRQQSEQQQQCGGAPC